jgi:hypothetical protein
MLLRFRSQQLLLKQRKKRSEEKSNEGKRHNSLQFHHLNRKEHNPEDAGEGEFVEERAQLAWMKILN